MLAERSLRCNSRITRLLLCHRGYLNTHQVMHLQGMFNIYDVIVSGCLYEQSNEL